MKPGTQWVRACILCLTSVAVFGYFVTHLRPVLDDQRAKHSFFELRDQARRLFSEGKVTEVMPHLQMCLTLVRKNNWPGEYKARIHLDIAKFDSNFGDHDAGVQELELAEKSLVSASDSDLHRDVLQDLVVIYESAGVKEKEVYYRTRLSELRGRLKTKRANDAN